MRDPGLTTEFAMLVAYLLGVLAMREIMLAAGLAVAVALLLSMKSRVHRFVQRVLTEQEPHDTLLFAVAAAIDLPLLPDHVIDPWQVLNLRKAWLLAVIVMGINAVGHVALRAFGARTGLLLAGLAGGFASSTATIASMGAMSKENPLLATACTGVGVVSNISTVVRMAVISATLSPALLRSLWLPLARNNPCSVSTERARRAPLYRRPEGVRRGRYQALCRSLCQATHLRLGATLLLLSRQSSKRAW